MRKDSPARSIPSEQLNLIDPTSLIDPSNRTGVPAAKRRDSAVQRRAATMTARHCNALLAELDRIATAPRDPAEHLTQLFEAAERAHARGARAADVGTVLARRARRV